MSKTLTSPIHTSDYVGRFAPSPSGPLHFGSIVCALASYIDAKRHGGQWLVRIEDIDPPREQPGASDQILRSLEAHGLHWDREVRYQSGRSEAYRAALDWLQREDLLYRCTCTRKRLAPLNGRYDGRCRFHPVDDEIPAALRLKVRDLPSPFAHVETHIAFTDRIKGALVEDLPQTGGDFVIHRKDGYFAYQLAVVIDDIDQGVTDIVRGDDLLDTTAKQIYLYDLLGQRRPTYSHIPVILDANGNKLSKQNHAPALNLKRASANVIDACSALGIKLGTQGDVRHLPPPDELLAEAVTAVSTKAVPLK